MSAAATTTATVRTVDQCRERLREIRDECERALYYGKTRQSWEWGGLPVADRKLLLMLAGVGSVEALDAISIKSYHELTPPERGAIATAHRSLRRLLNASSSLAALGAGVE